MTVSLEDVTLADLAEHVVGLSVRFASLEARVTRIDGLSSEPPEPEPTVADDADELRGHLAVCGPQPRSAMARTYGRDTVTWALDHGFAHVFTGPGGRRMLSAEPAPDAVLRIIGEALTEAPGGALSMGAIRALPGVNKNTVTQHLDRAIHDGLLRRGSVATGRAGRRQVIIARADRPLPIHWDTHKVDWDRA